MALEPQASESVAGAADGVLVPNPLPPALPDPGPGPAAVGGGGAQTSPISWKCSSLNMSKPLSKTESEYIVYVYPDLGR